MRRVLPIFALLLFVVVGVSAQNYKVVGMEHMPNDMTAREEMKADDNDRKCALIKVVTQNITPEVRSGFYFESDRGSQVVHRDIKGGEIRVWVSPGLKTLLIRHETLGSWELHVSDFGLKVESLHTYKVVVKGTMVAGPFDNTLQSPMSIYGALLVESAPSFCKVYIDGKESGITPKTINEIPNGRHEIKITKDGYVDYTENVTIIKGEQKQVKVTLNIQPPEGAIGGLFSVNVSKQVYFSQGNLQYQASTSKWRFAEHQYDRSDNKENVSSSYDENFASNYSGWIDLFGWGTSGYNGKFPYMRSENLFDYGNRENDIAGTNYDWGVNNAISNGGNKAGLWRTLTKDEWVYVFNSRKTASGIRYAKACVNNVDGVILLPDAWNANTFALSNTNSSEASYSSNAITDSQWAVLEKAGAVFLPYTVFRYGAMGLVSFGLYWSASYYDLSNAYYVWFNSGSLGQDSRCCRVDRISVRLVCNAN